MLMLGLVCRILVSLLISSKFLSLHFAESLTPNLNHIDAQCPILNSESLHGDVIRPEIAGPPLNTGLFYIAYKIFLHRARFFHLTFRIRQRAGTQRELGECQDTLQLVSPVPVSYNNQPYGITASRSGEARCVVSQL